MARFAQAPTGETPLAIQGGQTLWRDRVTLLPVAPFFARRCRGLGIRVQGGGFINSRYNNELLSATRSVRHSKVGRTTPIHLPNQLPCRGTSCSWKVTR